METVAEQPEDVVSARAIVRALQVEVAGLQRHLDAEAVHRLRVACGRLRVWLGFARWRVLEDDLRWLRHEAATVRDLDVQLELCSTEAWRLTLQAHRSQAAARLSAALGAPRTEGVTRALALLPAVPRAWAWDSVAGLAGRALTHGQKGRWLPKPKSLRQAAAAAGDSNSELGRLHQLRRDLRRVRYALEWLEQDATAITEAQSALGAVCDRCLLLPRASDEPGEASANERDIESWDERWHELDLPVAFDCARDAWEQARPFLKDLSHATLPDSSRSGR